MLRAVAGRLRFAPFYPALIAAILGLSGPVHAQAAANAEEIARLQQMMRDVWANPDAKDQKSAKTAMSLYGSAVQFAVPRGFIPILINRSPTMFMAEYVPDGESGSSWTQMLTVTALNGGAAVPLTLQQLAAMQSDFSKVCRDALSLDLGSRPKLGDAEAHVVAAGCPSLETAGAVRGEQAFIVVLRDTRNIYSVQFARRGPAWPAGKPPVDPGKADAELAKVGPILVCTGPETAGCRDPWIIANMTGAR